MKKKIFAACTILIAACCSFAGCSISEDEEKDRCAFLNEMALVQYSKIELTLTTDFGEDALESKYTFVYGDGVVTVSYTVESIDPSIFDETIITKSGTATIAGESVTVKEGDDIGISADSAKLPFIFHDKYFENAEFGGNFFNADVKDAMGFMGKGSSVSKMKTEVKFGTAFTSISVTYEGASGESVRAVYAFTK